MAASSAIGSSTSARRLPVFAVILAGGSGTRLWPMARLRRPKQFLALLGGSSLLRETRRRMAALVPPERCLIIAGTAHAGRLRKELPEIPPSGFVLEETARNTAASITLAALRIRALNGDGIMIILPADHWIAPAASFRSAIRRSITAVRRSDRLVTLGVRPRRPDPGLGYLLPSARSAGPGIFDVRAFVEKPALERARRMTRSGRFLWNSGIFVWRASTILAELRRYCPRVIRPLEIWAGRSPRAPWRVPVSVLRGVTATPIDRAVLERSRKVAVLPARFQWSDLGTWNALAERLPQDRRGNAGLGRWEAFESNRCLAVADEGLTVLAGVDDLVVVRANDVVLVCGRGAGFDLKKVARGVQGRIDRSL